MKVFKFGGASVNSTDRIINVGEIVRSYSQEKLLIVVSAMGKTTNALEKVVEAFFANKKEEALQLFGAIKVSHETTLKYLVNVHWQTATERLNNFFYRNRMVAARQTGPRVRLLLRPGCLRGGAIVNCHCQRIPARSGD